MAVAMEKLAQGVPIKNPFLAMFPIVIAAPWVNLS